MSSKDSFRFCPWDSESLGVPVIRGEITGSHQLPLWEKFSREQGGALEVVRCPVECSDAILSLTAAGFQLMDTLVEYRLSLRRHPSSTLSP